MAADPHRDLLQSVLEQLSIVQECRNGEAPEPLGRTIGELDAMRELHRLLSAEVTMHDYSSLCNCSHCLNMARQLDSTMKSNQREQKCGVIPRGPLSVTEYMQAQRYGYRIAAGLKRLITGEY